MTPYTIGYRNQMTLKEHSVTNCWPYGHSVTFYEHSVTAYEHSMLRYKHSLTPYEHSVTPYGHSMTPHGHSVTHYWQSLTLYKHHMDTCGRFNVYLNSKTGFDQKFFLKTFLYSDNIYYSQILSVVLRQYLLFSNPPSNAQTKSITP